MKLLKAIAVLRAPALNASNKEVSAAAHYYPQLWLLIYQFCYVCFVRRPVSELPLYHKFTLDRSYIASMIAALIVLSSGHAAWHIFTFFVTYRTGLSVPGWSEGFNHRR